ncbi:MAG: rhomboid family intramembrane serine protease [Chloroflexi bacterium]|nr:rhomboid family intramembrane serine protease [Chloroflexota bacterium]
MIPLSDEGRAVHRFPLVTVSIIGVAAAVFLYQMTLSDRSLRIFVQAYGAVPVELVTGQDIPPRIPFPVWFTLISSMFMHGGWMHIIGNMLYLWVFGDNIEDALGPGLYLAFYLVCGLAASGAQVLSDPVSRTPGIGASGAVAGVLGAYLLLYPGHRVNTLIIMGYFARVVQLPAVLVLGFWIALQLFSGFLSLGVQTSVAYWAHIGGFAAGMALAVPLALAQRRRAGRWQEEWPSDWRS